MSFLPLISSSKSQKRPEDAVKYLVSSFDDRGGNLTKKYKELLVDYIEQVVWFKTWLTFDPEKRNLMTFSDFCLLFGFDKDLLWIKRVFNIINRNMSGNATMLEFVSFCSTYLVIDNDSLHEFSFRMLSRQTGKIDNNRVIDVMDMKIFVKSKYQIKDKKKSEKLALQIFDELDSTGQTRGMNMVEFYDYSSRNPIFLAFGNAFLTHIRRCLFGVTFWIIRSRNIKKLIQGSSISSAFQNLKDANITSERLFNDLITMYNIPVCVPDGNDPTLSSVTQKMIKEEKAEEAQKDAIVRAQEVTVTAKSKTDYDDPSAMTRKRRYSTTSIYKKTDISDLAIDISTIKENIPDIMEVEDESANLELELSDHSFLQSAQNRSGLNNILIDENGETLYQHTGEGSGLVDDGQSQSEFQSILPLLSNIKGKDEDEVFPCGQERGSAIGSGRMDQCDPGVGVGVGVTGEGGVYQMSDIDLLSLSRNVDNSNDNDDNDDNYKSYDVNITGGAESNGEDGKARDENSLESQGNIDKETVGTKSNVSTNDSDDNSRHQDRNNVMESTNRGDTLPPIVSKSKKHSSKTKSIKFHSSKQKEEVLSEPLSREGRSSSYRKQTLNSRNSHESSSKPAKDVGTLTPKTSLNNLIVEEYNENNAAVQPPQKKGFFKRLFGFGNKEEAFKIADARLKTLQFYNIQFDSSCILSVTIEKDFSNMFEAKKSAKQKSQDSKLRNKAFENMSGKATYSKMMQALSDLCYFRKAKRFAFGKWLIAVNLTDKVKNNYERQQIVAHTINSLDDSDSASLDQSTSISSETNNLATQIFLMTSKLHDENAAEEIYREHLSENNQKILRSTFHVDRMVKLQAIVQDIQIGLVRNKTSVKIS